MSSPPVWPSRWKHSVGARNSFFEARFLARRCLCLHFTRHLAAPSARLEVKMVRYSFLVGLFHPRLHAGLSRRLRFLTVAARLGLGFVPGLITLPLTEWAVPQQFTAVRPSSCRTPRCAGTAPSSRAARLHPDTDGTTPGAPCSRAPSRTSPASGPLSSR